MILIISSFYNQANIEKSFLFLRVLVFYYIGLLILKEKEFNFEIVFNIFSITVVVISLDLIFQYLTGFNIIGLEAKYGATSFFYNEHIAGSFLLSFGFFSIYKIFMKFEKKTTKNEIIKSLLISIISIGIFISNQRMPMVIWILFLTFYGMVFYKSKLKSILFSYIILSFFIISFSSPIERTRYTSFYTNAKSILDRSTMVYKTNKDEKKLNQIKLHLGEQNHLKTNDLSFVKGTGHANLFGNAIFIWEKNKFLGIGYKNFYNKCAEYKLLRCSTHPHNSYLDILVTVGLLGLMVMIIYLFFITLRSLQYLKICYNNKKRKNYNQLFILLINFLIIFFPFKSSGSFFSTANITYTMIILILLNSYIDKKFLKKLN
ncbi:O-antigen ligase family protein [Pelagibacteraceae bacterium]|nr:O-antigen ligase family protein [Pelagibacteraceae bacterium]